MSALILAVPSKGRLQENAEAFFAGAGLALVKPRGARDYRGTVANLPGVEVAFVSAAEIAAALAAGAVHFGITGEDLVREMIPAADAKVVLLDGLGFGHANVAVAVPASDRRAQHGGSRRRRDRVPAAARPAPARRHEIHQSHPRLLRPSTASSTTASSRARARPKARRPPAPPTLSSTSPPPARRWLPTASKCSTMG